SGGGYGSGNAHGNADGYGSDGAYGNDGAYGGGDAYGPGAPGRSDDGYAHASAGGAPHSAGSPYDPGQSGAVPPPGGEPPKKRGALPWILGCGGCLLLLLIAAVVGGIIWLASSGGTTDPQPGGDLPPLPEDVQGFTTTDTDPMYATYEDEDAETYNGVAVTFMDYGTIESTISIVDNPQEYGNWTCGDFGDTPLCVMEAHDGVLQTLSVTMDEQELAEWSQAYEEAWQ
ncbi:MAG: hypothetical protein Q4G40_09855, partial [Brachybacterium sp.]|nr:hypothetical protein [Brachybacterium sp.]